MSNTGRILLPIAILLMIPHVAFAAWWNPFTWNVFRSALKTQQISVATTTPTITIVTTTKKEDTKAKQDIPKPDQGALINSLKKQVEELSRKVNQPKVEQPKVEIPKTSIFTLPSGAAVETDANGNIIRTVKEAPQLTYTAPIYTPPQSTQQKTDINNTSRQSVIFQPSSQQAATAVAEELRQKQADLEQQEAAYQQAQQVLNSLMSQVNNVNQQKIAAQQAYQAKALKLQDF